jgi:hypothetical protein
MDIIGKFMDARETSLRVKYMVCNSFINSQIYLDKFGLEKA